MGKIAPKSKAGKPIATKVAAKSPSAPKASSLKPSVASSPSRAQRQHPPQVEAAIEVFVIKFTDNA